MTTLRELIEFTRHQLSGLGAQADAVAALVASASPTDLTLSVDEAQQGRGGVVEVDFETMRVKSTDPQTGTLTLYPFGRGYRGTTATVHSEGSEVTFNPTWPAAVVARELNGVLVEIYPLVYAVKHHETTLPPEGGVQVPADAIGVVSVWVEGRAEDEWVREDRWDFNPDGSTVNRGLRIGGLHATGTALRVVYAARPGVFDLNGDVSQEFEATTGLSSRVADLLMLGVAKRLTPFIDVAKLPALTASAADAGEARAPGTGASAARLLHQLFMARLEQEASVLTKEHPIRVHRTR